MHKHVFVLPWNIWVRNEVSVRFTAAVKQSNVNKWRQPTTGSSLSIIQTHPGRSECAQLFWNKTSSQLPSRSLGIMIDAFRVCDWNAARLFVRRVSSHGVIMYSGSSSLRRTARLLFCELHSKFQRFHSSKMFLESKILLSWIINSLHICNTQKVVSLFCFFLRLFFFF